MCSPGFTKNLCDEIDSDTLLWVYLMEINTVIYLLQLCGACGVFISSIHCVSDFVIDIELKNLLKICFKIKHNFRKYNLQATSY